MMAGPLKYLPPVNFTVAPQATLNQVAAPSRAQDQQSTLAAENSPLRVTFGADRIGAHVAYALAYQGKMVLLCVWGLGEIDAISDIEIDGADAPAIVTATHYTGTAAQTVNSTLVAAFAAQVPPKSWSSALTGIAYSVITVPPGLGAGFPNITALIRGLKLFDPRNGAHVQADPSTWTWSDNPALALARFLYTIDGFGLGKQVNNASLIAASNACDEIVSGEKRRLIGLTLDSVQPDRAWVEALRTYAGCFVVGLATAEVKLVPDRPRAAVRTLDFNAGQILDYGGIELSDILQSPTFVQVRWRDTTSTPWRDTYGPGAYASGVAAGTADYIPSQVALPGIRRRSQAAREEIERVNKLNLANLSFWIDVFDEALDLEVGDRVDVILPDLGATAKPMVVARIEGEYGRYRLSMIEYDPAVYSDAIVAEPTWSDTTLPTPANPPAPTNLVLTEEWTTAADGSNRTRIVATWTGVVYPFLRDYRVTIRQSASVIDTIVSAGAEARTGSLIEGLSYQVDVQTISTSGAASSALSAARTLTGSTTPPGNVTTWYTALEAGGKVTLAWSPVAGVTRYRLKYGTTAGSYATATLIDDFDATTKDITGIVPGTWRFYIVALSRAGLESLVPLTRDIVVTLDTNVLNTTHAFASPTLTSMTYTQPVRSSTGLWVTDFGDGFGFGHSDTNNATGTFNDLASNIFADPHTSGTSVWESESWDFGAVTAGAWGINVAVAALSGSAVTKIRLSTNGSTWTDTIWSGVPVKASARYLRIRVETTGTMTVQEGASATVTIVKRRDPNGARVVTTNASGATTVTLAGNYVLGAPQVSLKGTTAGSVRWDNLVTGAGTNSFDIYAFNAAGVQIAADVAWAFEGI